MTLKYLQNKLRATSFWNCFPNSGLRKLGYGTSVIVECIKQAPVVGLLLITLGDGGRGQVLSTFDNRPSPVDR